MNTRDTVLAALHASGMGAPDTTDPGASVLPSTHEDAVHEDLRTISGWCKNMARGTGDQDDTIIFERFDQKEQCTLEKMVEKVISTNVSSCSFFRDKPLATIRRSPKSSAKASIKISLARLLVHFTKAPEMKTSFGMVMYNMGRTYTKPFMETWTKAIGPLFFDVNEPAPAPKVETKQPRYQWEMQMPCIACQAFSFKCTEVCKDDKLDVKIKKYHNACLNEHRYCLSQPIDDSMKGIGPHTPIPGCDCIIPKHGEVPKPEQHVDPDGKSRWVNNKIDQWVKWMATSSPSSSSSPQPKVETKQPSLHVVESEPQAPLCGGCRNKSKVANKQCSRCKTMKYCSSECQSNHWSIHKPSCKEYKPSSSSSSSSSSPS